MIQTNNLSHTFSDQVRIAFPDISVGQKESLLILGESGAGKTTLLHILGGMLKPTDGNVQLIGENIYDLSPRRLDSFRGDHIGMVFQQAHFIPSISAMENIQLAQRIGSKKVDNKAINHLFDRLNIGHRKNALPAELSQGERQRLAIARAFINKPSLVLADELTSALDDTNCASVIALLKEQSEQIGTSLIMVTHDQRLKEYFANSIILKNWNA